MIKEKKKDKSNKEDESIDIAKIQRQVQIQKPQLTITLVTECISEDLEYLVEKAILLLDKLQEGDIIECPKCGNSTFVIRTVDKASFTFRRRECKNKRCKYRFNTKEMLGTDWNYKAIAKKVSDIMKDVKF